jgi:hypothetical protein
MAGRVRPAIVVLKRLSTAKKRGGGGPRIEGAALIVAIAAIIGVPLLSAYFPRWVGRMTVPLLAVTSIGVYLTVPDTERVSVVMAVMFVAAVVCFAAEVRPPPLVVGITAFVIIGAAIRDSGGRAEAIARAAGCFGVLLAAPVAGWLHEVRENNEVERRPSIAVLVVLHCVVVGFSSRGLIRDRSIFLVAAACGAALLVSVAILFAMARPVSVEP